MHTAKGEDGEGDYVNICQPVSMALFNCIQANPDYYEKLNEKMSEAAETEEAEEPSPPPAPTAAGEASTKA